MISKSYRVRELPPPPVVAPPRADHAETDDAQHHDTLPDGLAAPPEKPPEPPIELDALQIRTPGRWSFLRRRVRIPPRWEQWLADPQRRNNVGVGLSIAIHVALVVLLAFVLQRARANAGRGTDSRPDRAAGRWGDGSGKQERRANCANPWCGRSPRGNWRPWRWSRPRI